MPESANCDDRCYVEEVTFNNGYSLKIGQGDIVVFVGPNNAGKSQSIKDIYALVETNKAMGVVVKSVKCHVGDYDKMQARIVANSKTTLNSGHRIYSGLGYALIDYTIDKNYHSDGLGNLRPVYFDFIGTIERLQECQSREQKEQNESAKYPIQKIPDDLAFANRLAESFRNAFGMGLEVSGAFSKSLTLRCSDSFPKLEGSDNRAIMEYSRKMAKLPAIETQGDGMRGFVGVMLKVLGGQYSSYMMDEPESFLHPPQARIMGQTLGTILADNQQAFISTHSEAFIQGLLLTCPERLKIVRIEREGALNKISVLESEAFQDVWGDPLLVHSNIMEGLFNKLVVVCESDSDCMFYAMIERELKRQQSKHSESLYVHCGGKQRIKTVVRALKALGIDYRVICDIDIINDRRPDLKDLSAVCGMEWDAPLNAAYNDLASSFSSDTGLKVDNVKREFAAVLDNCTNSVLSNSEVESLVRMLKKDSRIGNIKHAGKTAIPRGSAAAGYEYLDKRLREKNIFMVPVGELEGFVPDAGGHAGTWLANVLEKHPDLTDPVYKQAKEFVESLKI